MDIKHFLDKVCNEIKYEPVKLGISEELKLHIQEIKEDYQNQGIEEKEAEEKAVSQMGEAEEIGKKLNKIHKPKLDWKLLLLIVILMGFGIVVSILKEPLNNTYIARTIAYMIVGFILSICIYFFDYKKMRKYSNVIYLIATAIMILPMLINGYTINGSIYTRLFSITIFPPTIAMPLYLIAFIGFIVNYDKNKIINARISINTDLIKIIIFSIISIFLMLQIPSFANAAILLIAYFIIATIKIIQEKDNCIKNLVKLYIVPIVLITLFVESIVTNGSQYRLSRITSSFYPESDPNGSGYVGMLQKEIIENAKIFGEANAKPILNNESIITEESNYTFIYLLGKTGILVTSLLVCTIILTSIKLIINAKNIKEQYGKYLIIGLSTIYILQSFATMLMNVNMSIQTNINLPFVTYGGLYFIVSISSISIIFSIYRRKDIYKYEIENKIKTSENE